MKTKLFVTMCAALLSMQAMAQDLPNGNFSSWENRSLPSSLGEGNYLRPTGGWDCLNSLAPGSCTQVEGRSEGASAVLLTSKKLTVPMDGMGDFNTSVLMLGDFLAAFTEGEPEVGIDFPYQPKQFSFWYKYIPVSGDVGRVHISFWQGERKDPKARWRKGVTFTQTVNDWTQVVVDLTAYDDDNCLLDFVPTKMAIEATSSLSGLSNNVKDGEMSNVMQEGSELYLADMAFDYTSPAVYTVCGSAAIFGAGPEGWGWDPTDSGNDMTSVGNNIYQLVKYNVALDADTKYEFKVVQDHSWTVNWGVGGQNGANFTFTVPSAGTYDVTFTFDLSSGQCSAEAVAASADAGAVEVPNGCFESWEDRSLPSAFGGGTYASPSDGWDCLNSLAAGSCVQVEGRTTGSSAALLTTKKFTVPMDGMGDFYTSVLMLGDFMAAFSEGEPVYGIAFAGQPKKFSFWYKYLPVTGDVGRVHISLWQGDRKDSKARWRKGVTFTQTVREWTQVVVDLSAKDVDGNWLDFVPDHMCIECTSTLSGMSTNVKDGEMSTVSQEGSMLYVTELEFDAEDAALPEVISERASDAPVFNLYGQRVNASYPGVVIQDGKKMLNK